MPFIPSKYSNTATANDEFISDFKANGLSALSSVVNPLNEDTGAISGLDADGDMEAQLLLIKMPSRLPSY